MHATIGMFFGWLMRASWQGAVVVGIVFLIQGAFQKKLNARWRYALWLLVLVKLLLPFSPRSSISLFNYAGLDHINGKAPAKVVATGASLPSNGNEVSAQNIGNEGISEPSGRMLDGTDRKPVLPTREVLGPPARKTIPTASASRWESVRNWFRRENIANLGMLIWAIGAGSLALRVIGQNFGFVHHLRTKDVTDAGTLDLFEECKSLLGICFRIELVETNQVNSPALYGFFRPRLLLPEQMIGGFSQQELRYIFLHELAHVKRRDMAVHWLATVLSILHWFNPVLRLAFRRMAADRELACDEMALSQVGEQGSKQYGQAIIKVLETCAHSPRLPWVMGILEDKNQMTRRISMILKFKQRSQWSAFAVLLLVALGLVTLTDARGKGTEKPAPRPETVAVAGTGAAESAVAIEENVIRPDLLGKVSGKEGAPVMATVFIYTAGPKVGSSTFCPSCYLDCRKSAKSDAKGDFKIESLDPQLRFRILVVAKNYEPKFVEKVDPAKGPIEVELKVSDAAQAGPERTLTGRVLNPKGDPIVGAVVNSHGISRNDGDGMWGTLPGVDPLSVTDEKGEFRITAREAFRSMDVRVEARAFANKTFTKLGSGTQSHDLVMTEGATVSGQVMLNGKPLKNVSVGIVSVDRGMEGFTGNFEVGTGEDGRFAFLNLPADVDYFVYGLMKSMQPYGAVPIRKIHSAKDAETTDVGDLVVEPAYRLAGRVVLADDKPVPPNTRLLVGREEAWDSLQMNLAEDGSFDATGIPSGGLSISVRVPEYRVSAKNASLDRLNPFGLKGRMEQDITNLVLLMEKGANLEPDFDLSGPESDWPRNRPLHGAEAAQDHSREWLISGRVADSESQEPIAHFRLIPGNADLLRGKTHWDEQHGVEGTNGTYSLYLDKRLSQPMLLVRAEGYLPAGISLIPLQQASANAVLRKGAGPGGIVLLPDGKRAAGVSVLLICADDEQEGRLDGKGELDASHNRERVKKTDSDGRFSFAPELGMQLLAAASPVGFKKIPVENLKTNQNILLEPYGQIRGTLKRASGPGKGEELDLAFANDGPMPRIQLPNHAVTDAQGHFEFNQVPAGSLQISYREYTPGQHMRSWGVELLKQVALQPEQNLEVNITAPDRPAAQDSDLGVGMPEPARQSGVQIKGQVLLPNGKPAAEAQVALQVEGKYLALARGAFRGSGAPGEDLISHANLNGEFTLPMYERAQAVIALSDEGFGKVSLDELEASPQIKLQAWGRIEGTLHIGRRLGTNEVVVLSQPGFEMGGLMYDFNEFQAKTDDQGHFVITYVPSGKQTLARIVPMGNGSRSHQPVGEVIVKAGGVTLANLGGTGQTVIGKLKFSESGTNVNWEKMNGSIHTRMPEAFQTLSAGKTREEQIAYQRTPEYKSKMKVAFMDFHSYGLKLSADGAFVSDEVIPGNYEVSAQEMPTFEAHLPTHYLAGEFSVPQSSDKSSDTPVDLGTIEVKLKSFNVPPNAGATNAPGKIKPN